MRCKQIKINLAFVIIFLLVVYVNSFANTCCILHGDNEVLVTLVGLYTKFILKNDLVTVDLHGVPPLVTG